MSTNAVVQTQNPRISKLEAIDKVFDELLSQFKIRYLLPIELSNVASSLEHLITNCDDPKLKKKLKKKLYLWKKSHSTMVIEGSEEAYLKYQALCNKLVDEFQAWYEATKTKVVVLQHKKENKYLILPYGHRWKKFYYNEIKRNLENELTFFLDRNFLHVTLTVPRERSIPHYLRQLKKAWKALHDYLVKKYGYFDYIGVIEPQNDGYPHLHLLIFADWKMFEIDEKKAKELGILSREELNNYLQSKGIGRVNWVKRYWRGQWNVNLAMHYVTKYLRKYWKYERYRKNKRISLFYACVRLTRVRTIIASRFFKLRTPRERKEEPEWVFFISIDYSELTSVISPNAEIVNQQILEILDNISKAT